MYLIPSGKGYCEHCKRTFEGGVMMVHGCPDPHFGVYHMHADPLGGAAGRFMISDGGIWSADELDAQRNCPDQGRLFGVMMFKLHPMEAAVKVEGSAA